LFSEFKKELSNMQKNTEYHIEIVRPCRVTNLAAVSVDIFDWSTDEDSLAHPDGHRRGIPNASDSLTKSAGGKAALRRDVVSWSDVSASLPRPDFAAVGVGLEGEPQTNNDDSPPHRRGPSLAPDLHNTGDDVLTWSSPTRKTEKVIPGIKQTESMTSRDIIGWSSPTTANESHERHGVLSGGGSAKIAPVLPWGSEYDTKFDINPHRPHLTRFE